MLGYLALYLVTLQLAHAMMRQTGQVGALTLQSQGGEAKLLTAHSYANHRLVTAPLDTLQPRLLTRSLAHRCRVSVVEPATKSLPLLRQSTTHLPLTLVLLWPLTPAHGPLLTAVPYAGLCCAVLCCGAGDWQCFVFVFLVLHSLCSEWVQPASRRLVVPLSQSAAARALTTIVVGQRSLAELLLIPSASKDSLTTLTAHAPCCLSLLLDAVLRCVASRDS